MRVCGPVAVLGAVLGSVTWAGHADAAEHLVSLGGGVGPARLPGVEAKAAQQERLDATVVERHADREGLVLPLEHAQSHRRRHAHVLVAGLDGDAYALGPREAAPRARGEGQRGHKPQDARERDREVEAPLPVPERGRDRALHRGEDHEGHPGQVAESVAPPLDELGGLGRDHQPPGDAGHHHSDRGEEGAPVQVLGRPTAAVVPVVGQVDVQEQVDGEHEGRDHGRGGRHGHRQGDVGVEQRAPEVRVAPARARDHDQQGGPIHRIEPEGLDHQEPDEGEQEKLAAQPDQNPVPPLEPGFEAFHVHRGREPEDKQRKEYIRHDDSVQLGFTPHPFVVPEAIIGHGPCLAKGG
mmetsp:Transcript_47523/g.107728  ORF Transcript_47523/g.107728 Transcript_47523/m.107728 type:complete len:353 (+) Transcript_47523:3676-4734(+)